MAEVNTSKPMKEEINLQYHWYLLSFFIIYLGSLLIPIILLMSYIMLFYLPNFLSVNNFLTLFTRVDSLIASMESGLKKLKDSLEADAGRGSE